MTGRVSVMVWICLLSFLVNYGRVAFAPLVDHFIAIGVAPVVAGLMATAVWFGSAAPRLPTGYILTFVRRHIVILGTAWWLCLSAAIVALSPSVTIAILAAFGFGLSTGAFFVAANPLVSELFPRRVGLVLGVRGMFSQIGAVTAPFLVATAIVLGTWRYSFAGLAVATVVVAIGLWIATGRTELPTAGQSDRALMAGIRREWRLIAAGLVFVGVVGFFWQGVFNFYLTFLGAEAGMSRSRASQLLTITFAAGIPSFIVFGQLADRLPFLGTIFGILLSFAACLFVLTTVDGFLAIALVSIVMGFVIHGLFPVGDAYLLASLPDSRRASAYSGYSATMMLVQAPGSVAVGLFAQVGIGYGAIFRTYAIAVLVIVVVMGILALVGRVPRGGRR